MNVQRLFKHRSNKQSAVVSGWLIKLSHVSTTAGFWSLFFSLYNVIYRYAFASIQSLCRGTRDSCHVVFIGIMVESLCCESFVNPKPFVLLFLHVSLFSGKSHRVQASSHCVKSRWSLRDSMQEFLEMVNLSEEKYLSWEEPCVCTFAATDFPSVKGWAGSHLEPTQGLEALVENHQVGQVTCSFVWGAAGARAGVKTWPRRWWRARRTHIARWTSCFFPFSKCVFSYHVSHVTYRDVFHTWCSEIIWCSMRPAYFHLLFLLTFKLGILWVIYLWLSLHNRVCSCSWSCIKKPRGCTCEGTG